MTEQRRHIAFATAMLGSLLAAACGVSRPHAAPGPASAAERQAAAELLRGEDQRRFDLPMLQRLAASPSPYVRRRTALALARLRRFEALPLLQGLLLDPDTSVAATAAFALGQVGDTAAVAALSQTLRDPVLDRRPTVAAEAAYALGKLRSPAASDSLTAFLARARQGAPEQAVGSALLATWKSPRPDRLDHLVRWTQSADPALRWRAAYSLVRRPDPRATPELLRLSADPDPRVRALALRGVTAPLADSAAIPGEQVVPLLSTALRDRDYTVRINAARALGSFSRPAAVEALSSVLGPDSHLAVAATESLGRIGAPAAAAAPRLRELAASESTQIHVRQAALEALARVSPATAQALAVGWAADPRWRLRAAAARALSRTAGASDPRLLALAGDQDGRVAAAALQAALDAVATSPRQQGALLIQSLTASDPVVRATALSGLARLADPATLPMVLDAFGRARTDTLNDAALAAVDALGALRRAGHDPAPAFFARFPRADDYLVRLRVRDVFGSDAAPWGEPLPITVDPRKDPPRASAAAGERDPEVVVETTRGPIRLRLFADDAPLTVDSFLRLAQRGYFDGQEWPRVVPNFVVQGGDPRGDTNGGPGYTIRDEINRHRYGTGTLGMALSGPDTGGSQFFVTHSPQPHLDGTYTVFGRVIAGQDVTERILPGDRILSIRRAP